MSAQTFFRYRVQEESKRFQKCLQDKNINVLRWCLQSQEQNPTENLWDDLRNRVRVRKQVMYTSLSKYLCRCLYYFSKSLTKILQKDIDIKRCQFFYYYCRLLLSRVINLNIQLFFFCLKLFKIEYYSFIYQFTRHIPIATSVYLYA